MSTRARRRRGGPAVNLVVDASGTGRRDHHNGDRLAGAARASAGKHQPRTASHRRRAGQCAAADDPPRRPASRYNASGPGLGLGAHRPPLRASGHLLAAAWALRANLNFYEALYSALASSLGAVLVTTDARVSRTPDLPCELDVFR